MSANNNTRNQFLYLQDHLLDERCASIGLRKADLIRVCLDWLSQQSDEEIVEAFVAMHRKRVGQP